MMWPQFMFMVALWLPTTAAVVDQSDKPTVIQEARVQSWNKWSAVSGKDFHSVQDDDIQRHASDKSFFDGIQIDEWYFRENGFRWHLLRVTNIARPVGPLWMVPHDDENAAFEAVISALKQHGGVAVVVNSGPGSDRRQAGKGACGVRAEIVSSCDPNRNFAAASPKFTQAFLSHRAAGQPVIALHTNSAGFSGDGQGGRGEITIVDAAAFSLGKIEPRPDGHFGVSPTAEMANYDTLVLTAYLARQGKPSSAAIGCRNAINRAGVHFWHERVTLSDGSMSNYLALNHPDIAYLNAESRDELDLGLAAARHSVMIAAYLNRCLKSGN